MDYILCQRRARIEAKTINHHVHMKKRNATWLFVWGAISGLALALCLGAEQKEVPKPERSRLTILVYPSGATGFFDPDTGKLYLYDMNLEYCNVIREITTLGGPMRRLRN
jgi:hypothetical protein